ncbi:hypothetical protein AB0E56_13045 [Microbacterium sp. NPDC028030]|uniref:hypothetical protein n=1 Tax=Microbacterium sp. NPDC028030 TaxID=3155124 RepID=UPI0033DAF888
MSAPTARKSAPRKTAPKKPTARAVEKPAVAPFAYTVEDDVLRYTTKAGHELVIDLDFPADLLNMAMGTDDEDRSEDEQFEVMGRTFGENFMDAYPLMGAIERRRLQRAVFTEFAKAMSMPLGESSRSSDS